MPNAHVEYERRMSVSNVSVCSVSMFNANVQRHIGMPMRRCRMPIQPILNVNVECKYCFSMLNVNVETQLNEN